jgi:hypothetical protein
LNTIYDVFPSCAIYRDNRPTGEKKDTDLFLNMIVFCTKSDRPIKFRLSTNADYLGSMARREFIPPDEGYELKLETIGGEEQWKDTEGLKRGEESSLEKYRTEAAVRHWRIMRTVLPDVVWQTW